MDRMIELVFFDKEGLAETPLAFSHRRFSDHPLIEVDDIATGTEGFLAGTVENHRRNTGIVLPLGQFGSQ